MIPENTPDLPACEMQPLEGQADRHDCVLSMRHDLQLHLERGIWTSFSKSILANHVCIPRMKNLQLNRRSITCSDLTSRFEDVPKLMETHLWRVCVQAPMKLNLRLQIGFHHVA